MVPKFCLDVFTLFFSNAWRNAGRYVGYSPKVAAHNFAIGADDAAAYAEAADSN